MKRSILGGGALLALALLFIGLTILFGSLFRGWRIDLTENGLYTVAPGTEKILKELKEPINLYFFYSESAATSIPELKTYGTRVKELLEEFVARSNGKLHLSVIDPQPYSEEEDRANELGIRGAPAGPNGQNVYFGLAGTNSTDGKETIEFFDPRKEEFLEYDVVKLVYQLSQTKKPVVGWMSSLPMGGTPVFDPRTGEAQEPPMIYSQAEQLFDVKQVSLSATTIDPDIDVLVLVHPKNLSPATQFALDQYALRGGKIILFVDPMAEADRSGADPQNPMAQMTADRSSNAGPLLTAWGVDFNNKEVVGDLQYALQVSMRQGEQPVRHLGILGLNQSTFNPKDVVDAGLSSVNVASIGHIEPHKGATTKFEPLIESSTQAGIIPTQRFAMLFDPSTLRDGFKPTGKKYTLAARITGNVKTAFPNGAPEGATTPKDGVLKESKKPLNLIVFADTDMLQDYLWVRTQNFFGQRIAQAWANNGDLIANALDNMAGSTELISVRGRATFTRPFERVEALRRNAEAKFRDTEQELERELSATEEKLTALQSKRNDKSSVILTPDQEKELDRFQNEKLRIRKQLRAVRLGLDQDITNLGTAIKVVNIVLMPLAFALVALGVWLWRRKKRNEAPAAASTAAAPAAADKGAGA
ncbi:MAG TPA: Gldg family protein [Steroidobacteraceae bacterium]|nr:Gldg family protein [Steroidobacteraceae bacterium]